MKTFFDNIGFFFRRFWYFIFIGLFFVCTIVLYKTAGAGSYFAIHDNLDLFIPQYQMMKNDETFFALVAGTDFLDNISRNVLPSEFSLYTILYMILPAGKAYVAGYFIKILIAMIGGMLLAYDILTNEGIDEWVRHGVYYVHPVKNDYSSTMAIAILVSFAYGILNLFPAFGIPFAAIPLIIYLLRSVYREPSFLKYLLIFCYPFLSYFSYHGIFIMGYLMIAIIWMWIRHHEFPIRLFVSLVLLVVGSVVFEYRLFMTMLFSGEVTIRSSIVQADMSPISIVFETLKVWANGMMHANDAHVYIVLPVCVIYFFYLNAKYIRSNNASGIVHDYFNFCAVAIAFNSIIYGLYFFAPIRKLFELLIPPLKGWQFNRTIFFNPFLWYASFMIVCYRICKSTRQNSVSQRRGFWFRGLVYLMVLASIAVIIIQPALPYGQDARYDDIYYTAYGEYYKHNHDGKTPDNNLSLEEFYDPQLFGTLKEEIGYIEGEQCAAYLMYPAQLEYNDISTLDGYLGFYSQDYKDKWRNVIAPALDLQPASADYFDNSGIRCYLYSGDHVSVPMYTKDLGGITQDNLYINNVALAALGCKYIFSRVEITNAHEIGLELITSKQGIAYKVYVYKLSV
ncbi:DUF6044 family protein [Butyrivibrio sp. TB]|uniref:DUF6044 family protein n=1 Tax=Butyrivibrio sp. TB TaxID=1520809 RepID=UPI0008B7C911|nr:DUF6044 family protein [Butyrivibrio sp. TB]SEQ36934.1 hypothetical protein SAMN02910382_02800 [Butyrivibrio sp. TB]